MATKNQSVSLYQPWDYSKPIRTDKKAKIKNTRNVSHAYVIEVKNAFYRNAGPLDGIFEIDITKEKLLLYRNGKRKIQTIFGWHKKIVGSEKHRLDITNASYSFITDYSGSVVNNIE